MVSLTDSKVHMIGACRHIVMYKRWLLSPAVLDTGADFPWSLGMIQFVTILSLFQLYGITGEVYLKSKRVSVEPYRSTVTPSVSGGVKVNSELKLQCSTLTTEPGEHEVREMAPVMVNTRNQTSPLRASLVL